MRSLRNVAFVCGITISVIANAQSIKLTKDNLGVVDVETSFENYKGKDCIKVVKNPEIKKPDEPTFVKLKGIELKNGTIEVNLLSKIAENAGSMARGFIGIAFRINNDNSKFECVYFRPTNARADDQLRRNHSTQYFSYPDYKFMVLRKESPGKYESYVDMTTDEWIKVKIEVKDSKAKLFLDDNEQPCLIVNDLKHGPDFSGSIGLWVDSGTEGYFTNLKIKDEQTHTN